MTAATAHAGVVKMLVMLLREDHSSRVAYEASDLLTILTEEQEEQLGLAADVETLEGMLDLVKTLLQASDALSEAETCLHSGSKATVPAGLASAQALVAKSSTLKAASSAGSMATSASEKPRISWSTASVEAKPGCPAILTLPNGDCKEVSVPQSPFAGAESGHITPGSVSKQLSGMALAEPSLDSRHAASNYPPGSATASKDANLSGSLGKSVSSRFGSLLKKLGSINLHSSSSGDTEGIEQPQWQAEAGLPISARTPGALPPESPTFTAFSEAFQPAAVAARTTYQPRQPSQSILRAVVTAMANLLSSNPAGQEGLIKLGAVGVIQDVLVLAGSVGLQSGLAKAAAHLVRCISNGNPDAQEAFGSLGSIRQLLFLLQVSLQSHSGCFLVQIWLPSRLLIARLFVFES